MLLYFKMVESVVGRDNPSFLWLEKEGDLDKRL